MSRSIVGLVVAIDDARSTATLIAAGRARNTVTFLAVFAVAFIARLAVVLTSRGGLGGRFVSYDTSVYYAASDALSFGRLPYRDFTLLHPPGLPIFLLPFAVLGRLAGDHIGFVAAAVAFMALSALSAGLVTVVARRMGAGPVAAALGGVFYAVWMGSVQAEFQIRLEPLGNLLILLGLLAYLGAGRSGRVRGLVVAGAAFGGAASVKIWWAVPLLVLIAWQLAPSRRRRLLPVTAGAVSALIVIDGPFLLAAPSAMWHMVVTEQLARNRSSASVAHKVHYLLGGHYLDATAPRGVVITATIVASIGALVVLAAAWRRRAARLAVTLLVAQLAVLALAPSWFTFYADYLTPAAAVVVATGIAPIRWRRAGVQPRWPALASIVAVGAVAASGIATVRLLAAGNADVVPFPTAQLTTAVADVRCLMSDEPTDQILLDALSRGLRDGCPNWVDITGHTYGPDKLVGANGRGVPRVDNPRWQRDLLHYLRSGDAAILDRAKGSGESKELLRAIHGGGKLADVDGYVIYRTPHGAGAAR